MSNATLRTPDPEERKMLHRLADEPAIATFVDAEGTTLDVALSSEQRSAVLGPFARDAPSPHRMMAAVDAGPIAESGPSPPRPGVIMQGNDMDVMGPVDYLVVEFPAEKANFSGEMAAELTSLVDRELVRVLDLVLLRKDADGSVEAAELDEADESKVGALLALESDLAMLLAEEDVEAVGAALEPGSIAAILVYENRWAGPFASSVRRSGGQLIASGRVPTQALLAAVEADETVNQGA